MASLKAVTLLLMAPQLLAIDFSNKTYCTFTEDKKCLANGVWAKESLSQIDANVNPGLRAAVVKEAYCQDFLTEANCPPGESCKWDSGACAWNLDPETSTANRLIVAQVAKEVFNLDQCGYLGKRMLNAEKCAARTTCDTSSDLDGHCKQAVRGVVTDTTCAFPKPPQCVTDEVGLQERLCPGNKQISDACTVEATNSTSWNADSASILGAAAKYKACLAAAEKGTCPEVEFMMLDSDASNQFCKLLDKATCTSTEAKAQSLTCKFVVDKCQVDKPAIQASLLPAACTAAPFFALSVSCSEITSADLCASNPKCNWYTVTECAEAGAIPAAVSRCGARSENQWDLISASGNTETLQLVSKMYKQQVDCSALKTDSVACLAKHSAAVAEPTSTVAPTAVPLTQTTITEALVVGATEVAVADATPFTVGRQVVIDAGTLVEEVNTVLSFTKSTEARRLANLVVADEESAAARRLGGGKLKLKDPLKNAHPAGATIAELPEATFTSTVTPWDSSESVGSNSLASSYESSASFHRGSMASDLSGSAESSGSTAIGSFGSYLQIWQWLLLAACCSLCTLLGVLSSLMAKPKATKKKKKAAPKPAPEAQVELAPLLIAPQINQFAYAPTPQYRNVGSSYMVRGGAVV